MDCKSLKNFGAAKAQILTCDRRLDLARLRARAAFFLAFFCLPLGPEALGSIQYKPKASPIRHELFFGSFLSVFPFSRQPKNEDGEKYFAEFFPNAALNYSLYFPETDYLLPAAYRKIFVLGAAGGAQILSFAKGCEAHKETEHLMYHAGLKGKFFYTSSVSPFAEFGLARAKCFKKGGKSKGRAFHKSSLRLRSYVSFGLALSWKLLNPPSIYNLDQNYGLNDIRFSASCFWFPKAKNSGEKISFSFCHAGLSFLF